MNIRRPRKKYYTDKSSDFHDYTNIYNRFFGVERNNIKTVLEIGVSYGSSLRMWQEYFQNAIIYGIDINPASKFEHERIKILIGDQTDAKVLSELPNNFDIIIDDGGHHSTQQIESFKLLFPKVISGGIYVVEDCCCSYWMEFNVNTKQSAVEYFKTLIDHVNFFGYKVNNSVQRSKNFL